jgi:casein kinase 1
MSWSSIALVVHLRRWRGRLSTLKPYLYMQRRWYFTSLLKFMRLCLCLSKLSILESLHDRHYIHLDVKPDNFALGIGELSNQVFLIDFGLAQLFRDPATRSHTVQTKGSSITGTIRYLSINCHLGLTPSRRDDLESLVYVIVYLVKGRLPWQGIIIQPGQTHEDEVLRVKQATTVKALCKGLPQRFTDFVKHIRCLGFRDKPDYEYLRSILEECALPETLSISRTDASQIRRGQAIIRV